MNRKKHTYFFFIIIISLMFFLPAGVGLLRITMPDSSIFIKNDDFPRIYLYNISNGEGLKGKVKGTLMDASINLKNYHHWHKNNFVLKTEGLKVYQLIKEKVFFTDPFPEKVIHGKNDWLFLGDDFNNAIKESIGLSVLNEHQVDELTSIIQKNSRWFAEQGIKYYFMLVPGKHSVYIENLPFHKTAHPTNYDLVTQSLQKTNLPVIDTRLSLLPAKTKALYYKDDSHWNALGAYLGYRQLMDTIAEDFPNVYVLKYEDIEFDTVYGGKMDLSNILNRNTLNPYISIIPKNSAAQKIESKLDISKRPSWVGPNNYEYRFIKNEDSLKVMIFRDSFFSGMMSAASESFGESVFVWDYFFDTTDIKKEHPDIVIHEISERIIDDFYFESKYRKLK